VRLTSTAMRRGRRASSAWRSTCHCSSPHSSACRPCVPLPAATVAPAGAATVFVERTARYTPPCDDPPNASRSTAHPVSDAARRARAESAAQGSWNR
jgi:hypothetical protein